MSSRRLYTSPELTTEPALRVVDFPARLLAVLALADAAELRGVDLLRERVRARAEAFDRSWLHASSLRPTLLEGPRTTSREGDP